MQMGGVSLLRLLSLNSFTVVTSGMPCNCHHLLYSTQMINLFDFVVDTKGDAKWMLFYFHCMDKRCTESER